MASSVKSKRLPNRWFCATNTDNMRNIIAQGLITEPAGFTKYYEDALEIYPGWIPLFKDRVPTDIIEKSIAEDNSLTTCIIEFSLDQIQGKVKAWGKPISDELLSSDQLIDLDLRRLSEYELDTLFIPTPLPTSYIKTIFFATDKEKEAFKKEANIYSNVPLVDLSPKVNKKLFSKGPNAEYFQKISLPSQKSIDYSEIYAYGGMLATLFYFSKNGVVSNNTYHSISHFTDIAENVTIGIKLIYHYFQKNASLESEISKMYHGLVNIIINSVDAKEAIIDYLANLDNFEVDKSKNRAQQLHKTLLIFDSIVEKTASEQFHDAKTPLEKMLLMLFFREDIQGLIEYSLDEFNELDYLLFAMIFGIRGKFIKTPKFLREFKGLQKHISGRMAQFAHQSMESNIIFTDASAISGPLTLVDMFKNNAFKVWFAKKESGVNCLKTTIKIPNGSYVLNSTGTGLEIIFDGDPKHTVTEVLDDRFYKAMLVKNIELYNKYLTQYTKIK